MLFKKKILTSDITEFLHELYLLLHAKTSLADALILMQQEQEKPAIETLCATLHAEVQGGKNIATALSQYPQYFESFVIESLQTAKTEEKLIEQLGKVVAYRQAQDSKNPRFSTPISYFVALLVMAFLLIGMMMIVVIPVFQDMYGSFGAELPVLTSAVIGLANLFVAYWWLFIALLIAVAGLLISYRMAILLHLPLIGEVYHKILISRLFRSLAFCLNENIPFTHALKLSADGVRDKAYAARLRQFAQQAEASENPLQSWKTHFPKKAAHIMSIGEQTQQLPALLEQLADMYANKLETQADTLYRFVSALLTLFVGTAIALIVIAMYLPIFKMGSII